MDWIAVVSRWTHVGTAIVLVGGTVFLRFVFTPAVERLSEAERTSVTSHVQSLWKRFIHIGILLFLVSGFYNYLVVALPSHKGDKLYHPLIGTKILLGFGMFFIASALVGRSAKFEVMRRNAKFWQTVILVLAAVIVGISGFAKVTLKGKPREENVRLLNAMRMARPVSVIEKSTIVERREGLGESFIEENDVERTVAAGQWITCFATNPQSPEVSASAILDRVRSHSFQPLSNGFTNDATLKTHGVANLQNADWRINTLAVRDLCRQGTSAVPELLKALHDDNLHVRHIAALTLGILPNENDSSSQFEHRINELTAVLRNDREQLIRSEAVIALGRLNAKSALEALKKASESDDSKDVRHQCDIAIERIEKYRDDDSLLQAYKSMDESEFDRVSIGAPAPDFTLIDTDGKPWKLSDFKGDKTVVLIWIFADWCPVCHGEFRELIQMKQQFIDNDVVVATIECHEQFRNRVMTGDELLAVHEGAKKAPSASYPGSIWWSHLSDPAGKIAATYGASPLAFAVHSEYVNRPSTIIIDKEGTVQFAYYGTFWGDRPSIHKTLEMIQNNSFEFQHPRRLSFDPSGEK
ncbi:MAG: redoxin domain-containing protein [Planctomyces sp.]|nr:redoxin domain-containing protein [Planctomyces sp.]